MRADLAYCDFLVLAPLQLEISELKQGLEVKGWKVSASKNDDFPSVIEATFTDTDAAYCKRHATIVRLNYPGVLNASVDTAKILEIYEPGYIVSFGIAGSFDNQTAPIGAVVFATSLIYYEPSKDKSNDIQSRMVPIPTDDTLLNVFRRANFFDIKIADGPFASGEKLFADIKSTDKKRILSANDKVLGAETEAAGVGLAAHRLCRLANFVVIKGISDYADKNKNKIPTAKQNRNRKIAASNAAKLLVELMMAKDVLRRGARAIPSPPEERRSQKASDEVNKISAILAPYGITTDHHQLYNCLYDRHGPIPTYYHWRQKSAALHWIDFKILTALRALPKDIISPVPLVTIDASDVNVNQSWFNVVNQLLETPPVTDAELNRQVNEISQYISRIGFDYKFEQEIRKKLTELEHTGKPEITLNWIRYMLGQFAHRRIFTFTWENYREKWDQLFQAQGLWFSIFEWKTILLGGKRGKQEKPGKDLLIEPRSYASLNAWLDTCPNEDVVGEFVRHFECHKNLRSEVTTSSAKEQLRALMQYWDGMVFRKTRLQCEQ